MRASLLLAIVVMGVLFLTACDQSTIDSFTAVNPDINQVTVDFSRNLVTDHVEYNYANFAESRISGWFRESDESESTQHAITFVKNTIIDKDPSNKKTNTFQIEGFEQLGHERSTDTIYFFKIREQIEYHLPSGIYTRITTETWRYQNEQLSRISRTHDGYDLPSPDNVQGVKEKAVVSRDIVPEPRSAEVRGCPKRAFVAI